MVLKTQNSTQLKSHDSKSKLKSEPLKHKISQKEVEDDYVDRTIDKRVVPRYSSVPKKYFPSAKIIHRRSHNESIRKK